MKDKSRTVAGNGEFRKHEDILAGSEACSSPKFFEKPPFSWHLVQFQARTVEKLITVTPCLTLVYIVYDGRTDRFRQNGHNLQEFTQICT